MPKVKVNRHLLRKMREDREWSLGDAAYHIGISRQALNYIERGMVQPRPLTLRAIAEVYGLDLDDCYRKAS